VDVRESAIQAVVGAFKDAWNQHDVPTLAALFTEQGDFVNGIGVWAQGREAFQEAMTRYHTTMFRSTHLEPTVAGIRFIRPDVAIVHATWSMTGERGINDRPIADRTGLITMVMAQEGDGWKIAAFQNTDILQVAELRKAS